VPVLGGGRADQGQCHQHRRGKAWSRSPRHLRDYFPASQAYTRSTWASSQASGGATPVDRCTGRRWDTNDCRQLHPVGEAPSRRAHRGIGPNHIPEGWVEPVVRGRDRELLCWDGSLACPSDEGSSVSMGPAAGGGASRVSSSMSTCTGSGSVSIGASGGSREASRVSACMSTSGWVAIGAIEGSRGAGPSGGGPACAGASELDCAASRGWKRVRRAEAGGGQRGRAGSDSRPCGGGAPGWPRGVEALHVPPAFHLPGPTPEGQCLHVAVGSDESGARVPASGLLRPWGGQRWGEVWRGRWEHVCLRPLP